MTNSDNISWGLYHRPSQRVVKDLLRNWEAISNVPATLTIMDRAKCEFGRDSLFEWPTNLNTILQKAGQNAILTVYIMETLFTVMLRKRPKTILCSRPQGERWDDRWSPVATPLPNSSVDQSSWYLTSRPVILVPHQSARWLHQLPRWLHQLFCQLCPSRH